MVGQEHASCQQLQPFGRRRGMLCVVNIINPRVSLGLATLWGWVFSLGWGCDSTQQHQHKTKHHGFYTLSCRQGIRHNSRSSITTLKAHLDVASVFPYNFFFHWCHWLNDHDDHDPAVKHAHNVPLCPPRAIISPFDPQINTLSQLGKSWVIVSIL